jgi:hypothetical protein
MLLCPPPDFLVYVAAQNPRATVESQAPAGYKSAPHEGKVSVNDVFFFKLSTVSCVGSRRYEAVSFRVVRIFFTLLYLYFTAIEGAWTTAFQGNGVAPF